MTLSDPSYTKSAHFWIFLHIFGTGGATVFDFSTKVGHSNLAPSEHDQAHML